MRVPNAGIAVPATPCEIHQNMSPAEWCIECRTRSAGRFVSDALRERTIAYDARELQRIAVRIGVAGGPSKVRPILGALRGGTLTTLVTDEPTAEAVLALDATGAAP